MPQRGSTCAEEESRTPIPLRALTPEASASTSFATSAEVSYDLLKIVGEQGLLRNYLVLREVQLRDCESSKSYRRSNSRYEDDLLNTTTRLIGARSITATEEARTTARTLLEKYQDDGDDGERYLNDREDLHLWGEPYGVFGNLARFYRLKQGKSPDFGAFFLQAGFFEDVYECFVAEFHDGRVLREHFLSRGEVEREGQNELERSFDRVSDRYLVLADRPVTPLFNVYGDNNTNVAVLDIT